MLGRILSTVAGAAIARQVGGIAAGPAGLIAGAVLPTVLRRLGPMGLVAAAVGGYAVTKLVERHKASTLAEAPLKA
jgi:hypothetical protein